MLKLFADECVNWDVVFALRQNGFNVLTVQEAGLTGSDDEAILKFACDNKRILLTYDRGFGDIFRFNIFQSNGIVVILVGKIKKNEIINIILSFMSNINRQNDLRGKLVIIGKTKIRIKGR
ncbi:DUF5615 family PIN-like protein [Candidatus Parcubacteria bacterium]|nr:DUF5615 family PIN-like protein [Candidatus Parcubacteria bacterium]